MSRSSGFNEDLKLLAALFSLTLKFTTCKTAAALLDINEAVARRSGSAEETLQHVTEQINKT